MSVQNIGILTTLIGLLILALSPYTAFGLTLLIVGAVVAIVGIITRK